MTDVGHTPHITAVEVLIHDIIRHHTAGLLLADVTGTILRTTIGTILPMIDTIEVIDIGLFQGSTLQTIDIIEAGDIDLFPEAYHQGIGRLLGGVTHRAPHPSIRGVTPAVSHQGTLEAIIKV